MVQRSNRSETLDGLEINLERKDARSHLMCVAKIASWTLAAAIIILSVVPPSLRPETGVPHELEHFLIYAITGFAFGIAYELQYASFGDTPCAIRRFRRNCATVRPWPSCAAQ